MAATEYYIVPFKMMSLKHDPVIVKTVPFTDVTTRKVSRIDYYRITGNILICTVDCATGGVNFINGTFPPATRVNLVKGITELEII
jgi:hypothetical protein